MRTEAARSFTSHLRNGARLILDGGLATELERRGYDISGPLWSARVLSDAPEAIEQLHYDYYASGAECVTSASYQASLGGFAQLGLARKESTELLERSVALACRARERYDRAHGLDTTRYVAASVGPFGAARHDGSEYHGNYGMSEAQLLEFHAERFAVLAESGADVLACETIPSLAEARALVQLIGTQTTPAWLSVTSRDGRATAHGEPLADVARLVDDVQNIAAVGVNCVHPDVVLAAIRELRAATDKPIVVYPNSGERWNAERRAWEGNPGSDLAALAPDWVEAGATLIGGCCRTGPADIARLARTIARGD
jgi:homocysteine S-methyltransferase